jgi:hypothetical protein
VAAGGGIDPIKVARRLWKETRGIGPPRSQRALRGGVRCRSSDPNNEDMSASATMQQETLLQHHPGWQSLEDRDEVEA